MGERILHMRPGVIARRPVSRRSLLQGIAALSALAALPARARAQATDQSPILTYFRIGAGVAGSTLYDLAGLVAGAISNPPGSRDCDKGGSCGVPNLIGLAQTTAGSVENLRDLRDGTLESGLVQADSADFALKGVDPFKEAGADADLRAIAVVGSLMLHVIVPKDSPAKSVADLKGKKINLGLKEGGTAVTARLVLSSYGLGDKKYKASFDDFKTAAGNLENGKLDAMMSVDGIGSDDIKELARRVDIALLPVEGQPVVKLLKDAAYITAQTIPGDAYRNIASTPSIAIPTLWAVSAKLDAQLAFDLTKSIWHDAQQQAAAGNPADALRLRLAPNGVTLPLHPGAQKFYDENKDLVSTPSTN